MGNGENITGLVDEVKDLCENVTREHDNRVVLGVDKSKVIDISRKLKEFGFDHVKAVTGVDYPDKGLIEVIYCIGSYSRSDYTESLIELKINLSREKAETPSLVEIWQSCEYPERETYEMFGVIFQGHPKLKLLLLPDDFEGVHPLRKDFKIPEEGIDA